MANDYEPSFSVGDKVKFEAMPDPDYNDMPRWVYDENDNLIDRGSTGKYAIGKVISVSLTVKIIVGESTFDECCYEIPYKGHWNYDLKQWKIPGFYQKIENNIIENKKCTCGSWAVYGKNFTGHAPQCDIYQKNPYTGI